MYLGRQFFRLLHFSLVAPNRFRAGTIASPLRQCEDSLKRRHKRKKKTRRKSQQHWFTDLLSQPDFEALRTPTCSTASRRTSCSGASSWWPRLTRCSSSTTRRTASTGSASRRELDSGRAKFAKTYNCIYGKIWQS